jgi:hypothetical protein
MEGITVGNNVYYYFYLSSLVTLTKNRFPLLCNAAASVALQTIKEIMPVRHIIVGDNCPQLEKYKSHLQAAFPNITIFNVTPEQLNMTFHSLPSRLSALR